MNTSKLSLRLDDLNVVSFDAGGVSNMMEPTTVPVIDTVAGPTQNVKDSCIVGSCNLSCYTCEADCWM